MLRAIGVVRLQSNRRPQKAFTSNTVQESNRAIRTACKLLADFGLDDIGSTIAFQRLDRYVAGSQLL